MTKSALSRSGPSASKIQPSKIEAMASTPESEPKKKRRLSMCVGCGSQIQDQYILRVAPDLEWHASCLKCAECAQFLDENCTCFVRDGKTYCKRDYFRLFGTKCGKCCAGFSKNDFVMRARNKTYHVECFRCTACSRHLIPGDEFALREDGIFCKADHEVLERANGGSERNNNDSPNNNNDTKTGLQLAGHAEQVTTTTTTTQRSRSHGHKSEQKTTRVRTVLNEKQLHTLRTCYGANPRPDALMKEQLTEMTNLSPRVIRVWFQNKRCKDKKKSLLMKQMQQQHEKSGIRPLQGVSMVASSPVRHDSSMGAPVEVQSYAQPPPWKALSDFAMQSDLEGAQPFQQLINSFEQHDPMHNCQSPSSQYVYSYDDSYPPNSVTSSEIPGTPELASPISQ